jgi:BirA family biotin operon repressor/biotin-[acetyl-CoA-carboxylase] ligase
MSLDILQIRDAFPGRTIEYYDTLDSTMHAAAGREIGTVVLADEQTSGLGRHGHSWHSDRGEGIYCSVVLEPTPLLTLALGLATADAITRATSVACDLRWPNDVLLGDRKVAGILVQLVGGKAIAGIGINVSQTSFPPELALLATSLQMKLGEAPHREAIVIDLLHAVDAMVLEPQETILKLFANASSYVSGRRVTVEQPDGAIEGTTAGLDPAGYLIVRRDDETDTLILAGGVRAAGT